MGPSLFDILPAINHDQTLNTGQCSEWTGPKQAGRCHCSFFVRHWSVQEGEGQSPDRTWREDQRQGLTPAMNIFIALLSTERQELAGVTEVTLAHIHRWCPGCQHPTINLHGL